MNRSRHVPSPIGTIFPIIPSDVFAGTALDTFHELLGMLSESKQQAMDIFSSKVKYPKTDIYLSTEKDNLIFEMSVPGLTKNDIEILYEDEKIIIKSKKAEKSENEIETDERKYFIKELKHSSFLRSWHVPTSELDFTTRNIESMLENGILTVIVPIKKEEKPQVQKIEIK